MAEHGIAIGGAGTIVATAHLPAYRKAGLPVAGTFDPDRLRADALVESYELASYPDLDTLLSDPRVTIVDVAITPEAQKAPT